MGNALSPHDYLFPLREDLHILKLYGDIGAFFKGCFVSGKLNFPEYYEKTLEMLGNSLVSESKFYFYSINCKDLELLSIVFDPTSLSVIGDRAFFFRGQPIINESFQTGRFFGVSINLLSEEADKILSINRNKFKSLDIRETLNVKVAELLQEFFESGCGKKYYGSLDESDKAKIAAEYESLGWQLPKPKYFCEWNLLLVETLDGVKRIEELKNYGEILCFVDDRYGIFHGDASSRGCFLKQNTSGNSLILPRSYRANEYKLIQKFLQREGFKSQYLVELSAVKLSKENKEPINEKDILNYCKQIMFHPGLLFTFTLLKRESIPCLERFLSLALKNPNLLPPLEDGNIENDISSGFDLDLISPRMLFPLARIGDKITVGDLDILAKRVYKNRKDEAVTETQIKEKYKEFIAF